MSSGAKVDGAREEVLRCFGESHVLQAEELAQLLQQRGDGEAGHGLQVSILSTNMFHYHLHLLLQVSLDELVEEQVLGRKKLIARGHECTVYWLKLSQGGSTAKTTPSSLKTAARVRTRHDEPAPFPLPLSLPLPFSPSSPVPLRSVPLYEKDSREAVQGLSLRCSRHLRRSLVWSRKRRADSWVD